MQNFIEFRLRLLILYLFVISLVALMNSSLFGQNTSNVVDGAVTPPNKEKFLEAKDLIVPWLDSGCHLNSDYNEPDCHTVTEKETLSSHRLTLYNADGLEWYRFSVIPRESDSFINAGTADPFWKNKKLGFVPFRTDEWNHRDAPATIILRMTGESPNWYEVEINEQTKETKFAPKNVPRMWAKTSWSHWLFKDAGIDIDNEKTKFHDKPSGKILEESANVAFGRLTLLKVDGDWAFVEGFPFMKRYQGWIRWRKGREILVGCAFNNHKVPELKTIDRDK